MRGLPYVMRARHGLVAGALLFVAAGAGAQSPPAGARATVSAREARFVFPREADSGWAAARDGGAAQRPAHYWGVRYREDGRPRSAELAVWQDSSGARSFASLAEVMAVARASLCDAAGMVRTCAEPDARRLRASVDSGRLVLTLLDSATIERAFGARPDSVTLFSHVAGTPYQAWSVAVEYVEPMLPPPDSARRARAERGRRAYERSIRSVSRRIEGAPRLGDTVFAQVGDTLSLRVREISCTYDSCSVGRPRVTTDSGWRVGDSRVAAPPAPPRSRPGSRRAIVVAAEAYHDEPRLRLVARREGRTRVAIAGLRSAIDTTLFGAPPSSLAVTLEVLPRIGSVSLLPLPDTIRQHRPVPVRARVRTRDGRVLANAPVALRIEGDRWSHGVVSRRGSRATLLPHGAGLARVIARVGTAADTATVVVLPRP